MPPAVKPLVQLQCCLKDLRGDFESDRLTPDATLVAGTVSVALPSVTAATKVLFNRHVSGGTVGHLSYAVTPGVGITFTSSVNTDTSSITYRVYQP